MKIEWAEPAELDLGDIYAFIARDVPVYAEQFVDRIIETVDLLHGKVRDTVIFPQFNGHSINGTIVPKGVSSENKNSF